MGGRTLEAMALIGIGLDRFSITPVAVGPIKAMIRSLDRGAIVAEVERLLAKPPADMRKALVRWADKAGVATG
jgi:phosphotransferase system enzyme I (PtsP)